VFDGDQLVYDPRTGLVLRDFVKALKTNSRPDSNLPLTGDITLEIIDQPIESDGFVDDYQVEVSYADSDADGVADDPDFFNTLVAPDSPPQKLVFFERTLDFNDLERYVPMAAGLVNTVYATKDAIELDKSEYVDGQLFYATSTGQFWQLQVTTVAGTITSTLIFQGNGAQGDPYIARTGRQNLFFQYRHNSALTNVIDPGATNIIDLYVVTQEYYTAYSNYIRDTTGTVPLPSVPTISQLNTAYQGLNDYKMVSDNIVLNSVLFKPLFGAKAPPELQGTIKVVRRANSTASTSEIKSQVVAAIDEYFSIDKWDFGDTFFFSELAAYLHEQLGSIISSVVLVPLNPLKTFGDLYEIRSAPNEIFVNAATTVDIEVIGALTQSNLRTTSPVSGIYPTQNSLSQTGEF
jgi:hypothetical protein